MSSVSSILTPQSAGHVVEHDGRTYKARALTQRVKADFERWLVRQALDAAGDHVLALSIVTRDAAAGVYGFHGEVAGRAMSSTDGALALAGLLFNLDRESMMALMLAKQAEVGAVLKLVMLESVPEGMREQVRAALEAAATEGTSGEEGQGEGPGAASPN